jgi:hypothetical protein
MTPPVQYQLPFLILLLFRPIPKAQQGHTGEPLLRLHARFEGEQIFPRYSPNEVTFHNPLAPVSSPAVGLKLRMVSL